MDLENQLKGLLRGIEIERVSQGAEALVYWTNTHPFLDDAQTPLIVKYRPPKPYRHAALDAQLTKHRTLAEARILQKLGTMPVAAPRLVFVDPRNGLIWMEKVLGPSLKQWIWDQEAEGSANDEGSELEKVLINVGRQIGVLHLNEIVHGDLTTSNIVLRNGHEPTLIDFGLGSHSGLPEDKAVDLYVLERAVISTHPVNSDRYTELLLRGYQEHHEESGKVGKIKLKEVIKRLEDVRLRGRKRSMVG
uniref:EKC/KEOPS complex subunit BUD32 n=1 Tax=Blastobotrys adeninivorans TaxID=409370 RepID=A0A060T423_BLAAD